MRKLRQEIYNDITGSLRAGDETRTRILILNFLWKLRDLRNLIYSVMVMSNCQYLGAAHEHWASLVAQMVKNPPQCRRLGFNPWVGKIPWRREWQPTPVFWPGEFRAQRSLVGYSPRGRKESDTTEWLWLFTQKHSQENTLNRRVVMCNICPSLAALSKQDSINWLPGLGLSCL